MKTIIQRPAVLFIVIAVLGSALVYQMVRNHLDRQNYQLWTYQYDLAVFTQLYQNLDRAEVDAAKWRLGALVTVTVDGIQQRYGQDADTKFALMLPSAKVIKTAYEAEHHSSK